MLINVEAIVFNLKTDLPKQSNGEPLKFKPKSFRKPKGSPRLHRCGHGFRGYYVFPKTRGVVLCSLCGHEWKK